MDIIKSINYDEQQILKDILHLHCNDNNIELDATYSKGNFYKNDIVRPNYIYDINPQVSYCNQADVRNLPLPDNFIEIAMFDPPFLATTGKSLLSIDKNNFINKRFGVYPNEKELLQMYKDSIKELYRVIEINGILIFKCQDKVSSGKQYMMHCLVYNMAMELGFYAKDLFILLAKNRIIADWQKANQQHARKYHSYYWVFKKM